MVCFGLNTCKKTEEEKNKKVISSSCHFNVLNLFGHMFIYLQGLRLRLQVPSFQRQRCGWSVYLNGGFYISTKLPVPIT